MSTKDYQDRVTSMRWQREMAEAAIAGRGVIVAEFFDEGCSRRQPWDDRPSAAALLASVQSRAREFDAVVVGEYERAFCGDQFQSVVRVLQERGVQVWLPETGGAVDLDSPAHQALMLLLGAQSQREVVRARHRVWAAMRVHVCRAGS
jgi:DNA invertase Pin-like site-specific DNA recombinase